MSRMLIAAFAACLLTALLTSTPAWSQEEVDPDVSARATETLESAKQTAGDAVRAIDNSAQAQQVSAGILDPIYKLAEALSHPAFYWIGFAIMAAGVVSFALQLTLGKLVVLARAGFSPSEIMSDALGLSVSLVGLVLTTQAAAENSSFTSSASAVLSATAAGAVAGFVFYLWGQRQELEAVEGRRQKVAVPKALAKKA